MSEKQNGFECSTVCWIVAAIVGLLAFLYLYMSAGFGGFVALILGILIGVIVWWLLKMFFCQDQAAGSGSGTGTQSTQSAASSASTSTAATTASASAATSGDAGGSAGASDVGSGETASTVAASAAAAPLMSEPVVKPSTPLAGEAELAARKGSWKYEGEAAEAKPAAKKTAAKKPAAKKTASKTAEKKAPAKKAAAKKTAGDSAKAAKPKRKPVAADGKPEVLSKAPAGGGDDLKLISGVGPKLEQTLNELGIYKYEQVAGWRKKEIAWVDDRLKFKGRIERDDWISQAKVLAKGGETEFSKRKKK